MIYPLIIRDFKVKMDEKFIKFNGYQIEYTYSWRYVKRIAWRDWYKTTYQWKVWYFDGKVTNKVLIGQWEHKVSGNGAH